MKTNKLRIIAMLLFIVLVLVACSGKSESNEAQTDEDAEKTGSKESFFVWDENMITGLTDRGKAQKTLVVPARCEGFTDAVFMDCKAETVSFEDDDDIDLSIAFMSTAVKTVYLPDGLTTIELGAFMGCENLEKVVLPGSLTELGMYAFQFCKKLATVEFRGTQLKTISKQCFEKCESLTEIVIPEGVEVIEDGAFFQCKQLSDITFPSTLKSIEGNAFNSTAARELRFPEQVTDLRIDAAAFGGMTTSGQFYGTGSIKVYITAGSWLDLNREQWDIGFGEIIAE